MTKRRNRATKRLAHRSILQFDQNQPPPLGEVALLPAGTTYVTTETGYRIRSPQDDLERPTASLANVAKDRAFRSANTLERLRGWGVGLRSYQEPWLDTTIPFGEALYYITVAYAQLERGILRERVRAGMDRAKKEGRRVGRPRFTDNARVMREWAGVRRGLRRGSCRERRRRGCWAWGRRR